jgi:hypothetical protein
VSSFALANIAPLSGIAKISKDRQEIHVGVGKIIARKTPCIRHGLVKDFDVPAEFRHHPFNGLAIRLAIRCIGEKIRPQIGHHRRENCRIGE